MNHREIKQHIKMARAMLKDYYSAMTEVDWATLDGKAESREGASKQAHRNEVALRGQSRLAHMVMLQVMSICHLSWSLMGAESASSFYEKHRHELSDKLFDALETTVRD